jgi:hypothetical protein
MAVDIYRPDQWHDFFLMVGGGSAALTGLVFVAMSINLHLIARDSTHRNRAIGTLAGFAAVFMICALVLMGGQSHVAVGIEWLAIAALAGIINVYGYVHALRTGGSPQGLSLGRVIIGSACYLAEMAGALTLSLGHIAGLYVAAVAMVMFFAMLLSGAWLLLLATFWERDDSGAR